MYCSAASSAPNNPERSPNKAPPTAACGPNAAPTVAPVMVEEATEPTVAPVLPNCFDNAELIDSAIIGPINSRAVLVVLPLESLTPPPVNLDSGVPPVHPPPEGMFLPRKVILWVSCCTAPMSPVKALTAPPTKNL